MPVNMFYCNNVMLIDDAAIDNYINERMIRHFKFCDHISPFTSVEIVLKNLKELDQKKDILSSSIPDFIFLDLDMPVMNGFEFLKEFERLKHLSKCKIIILTASINPADVNKAKQFKNVVSYLLKPLNGEELRSLMIAENKN
jgi:CheY-like chemotaxis protein